MQTRTVSISLFSFVFLLALLSNTGCSTQAKYREIPSTCPKRVEKFDLCSPDWKFQSILIHQVELVGYRGMKLLPVKDLSGIQLREVKRGFRKALESKGYKVGFGRDLEWSEYENSIQSCHQSGLKGRVSEYHHRTALCKKLMQENNHWQDYDAVMIIGPPRPEGPDAIRDRMGVLSVQYQVFDTSSKSIALSTQKNIKEGRELEQSGPTRVEGPVRITPYRYAESETEFLVHLAEEAVRSWPSWSQGELVVEPVKPVLWLGRWDLLPKMKIICGDEYLRTWH